MGNANRRRGNGSALNDMSTMIRKTHVEDYVGLQCGSCGIIFFVPDCWKTRHWEEKRSFFCPNGCERKPLGETERERADRLARELETAKDHLAHERHQHQKELKRIHKRVTAGLCQWCHRTFQNVLRHIKTKHPEEMS